MPGIRTAFTDSRLMQLEDQFRRRIAQRTFDLRDDIERPEEAVVRDILPGSDLNSGAGNSWDPTTAAGSNVWVQDLDGAGTDQYVEVYQIDNSNNAEDKSIGFLVVRDQTPATNITQWRFEAGLTGQGGVRDELQVEGLESEEDATGVIVDGLIYEVDKEGRIQAWNDGADQDGEQWVFEGGVGEKAGETVEAPDVPILTEGQGQGQGRGRQPARADGGYPMDVVEVDGYPVRVSRPLAGRQVA